MLLAEREPSRIRRRLAELYQAAIDANMDETHRARPDHPDMMAGDPGRTHPRGVQRSHRRMQTVIKQLMRIGCGYRNMINYPASYPEPHCGHPTAPISSMNGANP
jgi:hypothetical protein